MGNTLTGELPSTWSEKSVENWMDDSRTRQQLAYLQFEGSQFHDITDLSKELRITKVCFAIYGPPTENAKSLEEAYKPEQRKFATTIYDKIYETWREAPAKEFKLGFIFIFCKEEEKEYQVPIFRLLWETKNSLDYSRYIDTACRVYKGSDDWKENNNMPMMKYCHPKTLFYTCDPGNSYKFDPDEDVEIAFNTSPACDFSSRLLRVTDVIITTVGITVGVAALFTPAGFFSAGTLLAVGGGSAGWGVGRATQHLIDKATHGESLSDLESVLLFVSIAAAPLHLLNGFASARLTAGAVSGRIFSQSERILATMLMLTAVGIDSFSFIMNIHNLVVKMKNDDLSSLDVLQFSVSTLFFGNMLMQPKTAWGVIERAQQLRITSVAETMTDEQARAAFGKYLEENKGDGGIKDTSKIVRNLNRMEDPNFFFKSVKDFDSVKIAGRKGKTVYLSDKNGTTHQSNPNHRTNYSAVNQQGAPKINKSTKLKACLGRDYKDHKHLGNLNEQQTRRLNKVFGGAAGYDDKIVDYASRLADKMGVHNDPDAFMSLVEVVAKEARGNASFNYADLTAFHAGVARDLAKVTRICATKNVKFADNYKALYHYRKHGDEFMTHCTPKFYLGKLPAQFNTNGKLAEVCDITAVQANGTKEVFTRKTYFLPDNAMLVMTEKEGMKTISTMYKNGDAYQNYMNRFVTTNTPPPEIAFERLAFVAGLTAVQMQLYHNDAVYKNFTFCSNTKELDTYRTMIAMLASNHADFLDFQNNNGTDED